MTDACWTAPVPATLVGRYGPDDLDLLTDEELRRFAGADGPAARSGDADAWSRAGPKVAWELLYRKEPGLYERLIAGERIHPSVIERLPRVPRVVELAAGTGRLTRDLVDRSGHVVAVEPAAAMRDRLRTRFPALDVREGFFDAVPVPDGWADAVVSCSAFTPDPAHGGDTGLAEMERIAAPGGTILIVWPVGVEWLRDRGFDYATFPGDLAIEFASVSEARELAGVFYPDTAGRITSRFLPYELTGMTPPRDLAWKRVA